MVVEATKDETGSGQTDLCPCRRATCDRALGVADLERIRQVYDLLGIVGQFVRRDDVFVRDNVELSVRLQGRGALGR